MRRILIVGFGDIAQRLVLRLSGRFRVYGLVRSASQIKALRAMGVTPIVGDLDQPLTLRRLAGIAHIIVHLAPPAPRGKSDLRTRALLTALAQPARSISAAVPCEYSQSRAMLPQQFIYISTSGIYGDCAGASVPETRLARPSTDRAKRRADAEAGLRAWSRRTSVRLCILRVPSIYAKDRMPLDRLRRGTPVHAAYQDVYSSHIHAQDLVRAILAAICRGAPSRSYNCCDDSMLRVGDYFDLIADRHSLPRPLRVSKLEAPDRIPKSLLSFMRESRRLDNRRLKRELRLRLDFPTVWEGIRLPDEIRR